MVFHNIINFLIISCVLSCVLSHQHKHNNKKLPVQFNIKCNRLRSIGSLGFVRAAIIKIVDMYVSVWYVDWWLKLVYRWLYIGTRWGATAAVITSGAKERRGWRRRRQRRKPVHLGLGHSIPSCRASGKLAEQTLRLFPTENMLV